MRKLALLVAVTVVLASRPAEAGCGGRCPRWLDPIAYGLLAAMVGGYAYGTGYFIYHDLTDDEQSIGYGATEAILNGALGSLAVRGTIDAIQRERPVAAVVWGGITALHGTLAVHGTWRMWEQRPKLQLDRARDRAVPWIARIAYGTNTLIWTAQLGGRHGRGYGIAEAAINGPLALGLGYLAIDRIRNDDGGVGMLYGGLAVLSGALTYHGLKTAIAPPEPPGIDLLGTALVPTVVSDGHALAPGLGLTGTW